jgi:hypothetical protein
MKMHGTNKTYQAKIVIPMQVRDENMINFIKLNFVFIKL